MRKFNRELRLAEYDQVFDWANEKHATINRPINIPKYGGRSPRPFRLHIEEDGFILRSNPEDSSQRRYILTRERWNLFCNYVSNNPDMIRGVLANNYREYGCTNKYFWPSIISISKQFYEQIMHS